MVLTTYYGMTITNTTNWNTDHTNR